MHTSSLTSKQQKLFVPECGTDIYKIVLIGQCKGSSMHSSRPVVWKLCLVSERQF